MTGKLPRLWPQGVKASLNSDDHLADSLVIDARGRRAYVLYGIYDESVFATGRACPYRVGIRSYDLDTLRPLRYASIEGRVRDTDLTAGWEFDYALDSEGRRLFVPVLPQRTSCSQSAVTDARVRGEDTLAHVSVIDLASFDEGEPFETRLLPNANSASQSIPLLGGGFRGIRYFVDRDGAGKLLLAFSPNRLAMWHADRVGAGGQAVPDEAFSDVGGAPRTLSNCSSFDSEKGNQPMWKSLEENAIFTVCQARSVLRVDLNASGAPTAHRVSPGPPRGNGWMVGDPHSDRLFVYSQSALWTIDGRSMQVVGKAGLQGGPSLGIDETTGRIYGFSDHGQTIVRVGDEDRKVGFPGGISMVDGRLTPTPQALLFPDLAYASWEPIRVEPATPGRPTRLFIRRAGAVDPGPNCFSYPSGDQDRPCPAEDFWVVVEDRVPPATQPTLLDLDRLTVDQEEKPGIADANYEGTGSAAGTRVLAVGGLRSTARLRNNPSEFEQAGPNLAAAQGLEPICWTQNRELRLGWVEEVTHASLQTNAAANPVWADQSSRDDLESPAVRCWPAFNAKQTLEQQRTIDRAVRDPDLDEDTPDDPRTRWRIEPVECVEQGTERIEPTTAFAGHLPGAMAGEATVTCQAEADADQASAHSVGKALELEQSQDNRLSVAWGTSDVVVSRDEDGVHVTATAEARGIRIGPVSIGYVHAQATSHAAGRPKTATTTFERTVCDVEGPGSSMQGCMDDEQTKKWAADMSNTPLFRQAGWEILAPDPDPGWSAGTPRGYGAAVLRDAREQLNAQLLYGDIAEEVPGLEIVLRKDTSLEVGRNIIQLAAVRAVTTYGIYLLQDGIELPPLPPELDLPPQLPAIGEPAGVPLPSFGAPPPSSLPPTSATAPPARVVAVGGTGFAARPLGEGLLTSLMWFVIGLPVYLATRRRAFARSVD